MLDYQLPPNCSSATLRAELAGADSSQWLPVTHSQTLLAPSGSAAQTGALDNSQSSLHSRSGSPQGSSTECQVQRHQNSSQVRPFRFAFSLLLNLKLRAGLDRLNTCDHLLFFHCFSPPLGVQKSLADSLYPLRGDDRQIPPASDAWSPISPDSRCPDARKLLLGCHLAPPLPDLFLSIY